MQFTKLQEPIIVTIPFAAGAHGTRPVDPQNMAVSAFFSAAGASRSFQNLQACWALSTVGGRGYGMCLVRVLVVELELGFTQIMLGAMV